MNEKDFVRRDVYEAEKENLLGIIKDTRDRLEDYKESSTRQITFWGLAVGVIAILFAGLQVGIAVFLYILAH